MKHVQCSLNSWINIFAASIVVAAACVSSSALAQTFSWASAGVADDNSVDGVTVNATSGPVTMTVTVDDDAAGEPNGVDEDAYSNAGQGPASFENDGTFGGLTNFVEFGFDNNACDTTDQFEVELDFSVAVNNLQFTLADIDQSTWDDIIEIELDVDGDGVAGFQNIKQFLTNTATGAPLLTLGSNVSEDDETFADGYEGNVSVGSGSTTGNIALDTSGSGLAINAVIIRYFSGDDAACGNPGSQRVGISDVTFSGTTVPVSVSHFYSSSGEGTLSVNWETVQEVGHAGFQIYARGADGWYELSNGLMQQNQSGDSLSTKSYSSTFTVENIPTWLALVDVSVNEEVVPHGPFRVGQAYGASDIGAEPFDWSTVTTEQGLNQTQRATVAERIRQAKRLDAKSQGGQ